MSYYQLSKTIEKKYGFGSQIIDREFAFFKKGSAQCLAVGSVLTAITVAITAYALHYLHVISPGIAFADMFFGIPAAGFLFAGFKLPVYDRRRAMKEIKVKQLDFDAIMKEVETTKTRKDIKDRENLSFTDGLILRTVAWLFFR